MQTMNVSLMNESELQGSRTHIKGKQKLPRAAGIEGIMNMNTMMAPCKVKIRL